MEDAALLVNPLDISEIAHAMRQMAEEDGLRERLIQKGFEQAKKFSWQKAGRELLNVIHKI